MAGCGRSGRGPARWVMYHVTWAAECPGTWIRGPNFKFGTAPSGRYLNRHNTCTSGAAVKYSDAGPHAHRNSDTGRCQQSWTPRRRRHSGRTFFGDTWRRASNIGDSVLYAARSELSNSATHTQRGTEIQTHPHFSQKNTRERKKERGPLFAISWKRCAQDSSPFADASAEYRPFFGWEDS